MFNLFISKTEFSIISKDTQAVISPNQLSFLYFFTTSVIVSPDGSFPFFLICNPTKTGLFQERIIQELKLTVCHFDCKIHYHPTGPIVTVKYC